jgi:hypothetical protein
MNKVYHYALQFKRNIFYTFSINRILKYGIRLAIYDFVNFLLHRSGGAFQHYNDRKRDEIVQKYLYKNYGDIIFRIKE